MIAAALLAPVAAGGCGGDDGRATTTAAATVSTTSIADEPAPIRKREDILRGGDASGEGSAEPATGTGSSAEAAERARVREAQSAYRRYVAAINARDGAALCRLIAPGFEDELELPERGDSCADRLAASIGYEDPRGSPAWAATELGALESAIVGDSGRVQLSVAIATRFADRDETSLESDIAFLEPSGGGYVLAKAPGSLWRAVGKPDIPPTVITPPPGF